MLKTEVLTIVPSATALIRDPFRQLHNGRLVKGKDREMNTVDTRNPIKEGRRSSPTRNQCSVRLFEVTVSEPQIPIAQSRYF
jgi:hypothetical protein